MPLSGGSGAKSGSELFTERKMDSVCNKSIGIGIG